MSATTATQRGRELAEALMVDTCTINAKGTREWVNDAYVNTPGAELYSGQCQVQVLDSVTVQTENVGEQLAVTERVMVKIPITAPSVAIDSVVTITAVDAASDSALVDRTYRVTGSHAKTYATARRLPCELVTT